MPLLLATRKGLYLANGESSLSPLIEADDFLALARSLSNPAVLYAGTTHGTVYRSADGGQSWEEIGRIEGFTGLSCLAVDPLDPARLLAGMEPAALFQSDDGGKTWREDPVIRRMSETNDWMVPWSDAKGHVRTISIDPNDPRRIYLAIEVGGVVRSEDGGETWENVHGGIHDDVHAVAVNPQEGRIVYAATRHRFGRSEDHGKTWRQINAFEGQGYSRPLAVNPDRPDQIFTAAATVGPGGFDRPGVGAECGVFRSDDGGLSWTHLMNGLPAYFKSYVDGLDVNPANPSHVALATSDGEVYQSEDGGGSWQKTLDAPPVRRLLAL
jgi:hypothetical protein